jgi:hypothetical protein
LDAHISCGPTNHFIPTLAHPRRCPWCGSLERECSISTPTNYAHGFPEMLTFPPHPLITNSGLWQVSSSRSPWRARSRLRVLPGTPTTPRLLLPTLVPKKVDQGAHWNGRTLRPSIAHLPAAVPQYNNKWVTLAPFTPSFVHRQFQTMEMRVCLGFRFHSYFFWHNNCHCCFSHSLLYIDLRSYFCGRHNVLAYYCWLFTYYIFTMMIYKKGYASI